MGARLRRGQLERGTFFSVLIRLQIGHLKRVHTSGSFENVHLRENLSMRRRKQLKAFKVKIR